MPFDLLSLEERLRQAQSDFFAKVEQASRLDVQPTFAPKQVTPGPALDVLQSDPAADGQYLIAPVVNPMVGQKSQQQETIEQKVKRFLGVSKQSTLGSQGERRIMP